MMDRKNIPYKGQLRTLVSKRTVSDPTYSYQHTTKTLEQFNGNNWVEIPLTQEDTSHEED